MHRRVHCQIGYLAEKICDLRFPEVGGVSYLPVAVEEEEARGGEVAEPNEAKKVYEIRIVGIFFFRSCFEIVYVECI